ncbi:hypothetical protein DVH05_019188 [Phytophthora capsici]|nr:hypothetical protein DVH05_019188 [Phytophthora capsici]
MASNQEEDKREYLIEKVKLKGGSSALKPAKRGGSTLTQVGSSVYLIGGANREGTSYGDVHCFDLESREWAFVKPSSGKLPPRSGHSAVAIGDEIYVFGGLDAAESEIYNDVHIFNTRTLTWTFTTVEGEIPLPRNAHAAIALPEKDNFHRMLMYGGSSPESGAFNDLHLLLVPVDKTMKLRWEMIVASGETPEARELHCPLLQSETVVCFAGGRNFDGKVCTDMAMLSFSSWTWQLVPICEWNRCSLVAGAVDGELISFGGWNGDRICGDCCRYSDDEESWLAVTTTEKDPTVKDIPERFGHCGTTVTMPQGEKTRKQALLIFGGMNSETDLDDLILISKS